MRSMLRLAVLAMILALAAGAGWAQDGDIAISAVAYSPVPDQAAIRVETHGTSELDDRTKRAAIDVLQGQGRLAEDDAPFILALTTTRFGGASDQPLLGQFEASESGAEIQFNIWSTQQDSLMERHRVVGSDETQVRIDISVYDRATGRYAWRGTAAAVTTLAGAEATVGPMVERLLGFLGQTANEGAAP
jgi:hypothetical protein